MAIRLTCQQIYQNPFRTTLSFLIATALAVMPNINLMATDDPATTRKELDEVKKEIRVLEKTIKKIGRQRTKVDAELQNSETEISKNSEAIRQTTKRIQHAKLEISALKEQHNRLNIAKTHQKQALITDIISTYKTGRQEYLKLLLNQQQPEKLGRVLKYYDYIHEARHTRIQEYGETMDNIRQANITIENKVGQLKDLQLTLKTQTQSLGKSQQLRRAVLARLDKSLTKRTRNLGRLKSNATELQQLLNVIEKELAESRSRKRHHDAPFAKRKGQMAWPLNGKILRHFGSHRGQGKRLWNGVFINAAKGSPVLSVHSGQVVFANWLRGFGMLLIIDHGNGYYSLYGHNESLSRKPGQWINAGEVIAYSGNSGGLSSPGLYFEIRKNGEPVNPKQWCRS